MTKPLVAVLVGGASAESDVSRSSAAEVAQALTNAGYRVEQIEADQSLSLTLCKLDPDVVFPALDGPPGEDGTVQGLLAMLGVPYVGSDVRGSALAMDKSVAKLVFTQAQLPVVSGLSFAADVATDEIEKQVLDTLGERVVVKPLRQGSALGVTINANGGPIREAIELAQSSLGGLLVESYFLGDEVTVGVLDLHAQQPVALPATEVRTAAGEWYDYENRYAAGKSEHIIPPAYPTEVLQELQRIALAAHRALGLRDLSRADFLVAEQRDIVLLEVNSLPGMTPTSLFPDAARAAGISFTELVAKLVDSALARGAD